MEKIIGGVRFVPLTSRSQEYLGARIWYKNWNNVILKNYGLDKACHKITGTNEISSHWSVDGFIRDGDWLIEEQELQYDPAQQGDKDDDI